MAGVQRLENAYRSARSYARDVFLLEGAVRAVRALEPKQQATVRKYFDAGVRRAAIADELTDERGAVAALLLYRDAVALLVAAVASSRDAGSDAEQVVASPWETLSALSRAGSVPKPPASLDEARRILTEAHPLAFDEHPAEDLLARRQTVESAVRWLRSLVETRTIRELGVSRLLRVGVASVIALALLAWAGTALIRPDNLALHKTVTSSSRHPQSAAPADGSGLVNGVIETSYGIHTASGNGWVMIDLGQVYSLSEVKIFNRADGWFDGGLPFRLELSEDGTRFQEGARQTAMFSATDPWVFRAAGRKARYVRVASDKYVALAEIEVYGGK